MTSGDDEVRLFTAAAEHYCNLIESNWRPRRETLYVELALALSGLYGAALSLPDRGARSSDLPATRLSNEDVHATLLSFGEALDGRDFYNCVPPFSEPAATTTIFGRRRQRDPEVLGGMLSGDLGEIYSDVKEGLLLRADGLPEDDVIWQWRFNFWSHWGEHAVDALRVIHLTLSDA